MEDEYHMKIYKDLLSALESGQRAVMVTTLKAGEKSSKTIYTEGDIHEGKVCEPLLSNAADSLKAGVPELVKVSDGEACLVEPYFPKPHLYIFGGGHIALPLSELGVMSGFSVTVIDDRPAFANRERFPHADRVICESFLKCFSLIDLNESSFAVIITRGHRYDMDCLRNVLRYSTAYTGMIGSRRRVKMVKEQLKLDGYDEKRIECVNAPIGLDIGAVTPGEIAISIISEVISCRRLRDPKGRMIEGSRSTGDDRLLWPDFDSDVLRQLSSDEEFPGAQVTVVSTKGSTPRKPGAKMIVYPHGRIIGSIGGGCGEGEAIGAAIDVIRDGGFTFKSIDLTADEADEEGMACGGIMDVLIESLK